jgi:hypothetical protein
MTQTEEITMAGLGECLPMSITRAICMISRLQKDI